jgi:hemerythrin
MPLIEWNENLSVGVPSVDEQHKRLVGMLNELYDAIQTGQSQVVLGKVLKGLADYVVYHFQYEESLFAQTGYRAAAEHKKEHDDLTRLLHEERQKYEQGATPALSEEVLNFMRRWLFIHITGSDRKFGPYLISMGIK